MTDEDEIRGLLERYGQALNNGDSDLAMSCYAADAIFMPTTLPTVRSPELRGWYDKFFASTGMDVEFVIDEVVVAVTVGGSAVAYALTRSHGEQTAVATGTVRPESNREVFILTREAGPWKITRYLFNKPE
jgi:ketosteroid isomerase-like protein